MKKLLITYAITSACMFANAQTKIDDSTYKTRKGETIKKGDTLRLVLEVYPVVTLIMLMK